MQWFFFFFFYQFYGQVLDYNLDRNELSLKKNLRSHKSKTVSFIEVIIDFDWF